MNELDEKELLIQYGSTASEAMFDFPCNFFRLPDCIGVVAYRIEHHCAISFGDPLCPPDETVRLVEAFHRYCHEQKLNIIYITVSEQFTRFLKSHHCHILIGVCEEFIFDPRQDPCLSSHRLHHRVEKALKHGLKVHEYLPFNAEIENALRQLGIQWQKAIKGPQVYLGHLNFFETYTGKRWFYVTDGEQITAMIMLSRLEASQGWLLKFLIISPDAVHDTSEFLVTSVLEILRKENCHFITKGMMPVNCLDEVSGLGKLSSWMAKGIYQIISKIFKFKKRKDYWLRYSPKLVPSYLLVANPRLGLKELRALMKVFRTGKDMLNRS